MLQPLNLTFLQPQSIESDLNINSYANNFGNSSSDFSGLYSRNGTAASFTPFVGNNNTMGDELQIANLSDNFAISASQYAYKSDGFRPNNDTRHELYNLFMQSQVSNNLSIQMEYLHRDTDKGDLDLLFDPNTFSAGQRNDIEGDNSRAGFKYKLNTNNTLLGSYIYSDTDSQKQTTNQTSPPVVIITTTTDRRTGTSRSGELQHILCSSRYNLSTGIIYTDVNSDFLATTRTQIPLVNFDQTVIDQVSILDKLHYSIYSYAQWAILNNFDLNLGFSYDNYKAVEYANSEIDRVSPKFGLRIRPWANTEIRLASFQTVNRPTPSNQSLEPTHVTGFNQYFADLNGSKVTQHNIAFDIKSTSNVRFGFISSYREIDAPRFAANILNFDDMKELNHKLYIDLILNRYTSLSAAAEYEGFENINNVVLTTPKRLKTILYPVNLAINLQNGFNFSLLPTYVDHDYIDSSLNQYHDSFVITDLAVGYRFPNRNGLLSIGIHNLFDEQFNYYNLNYTGTDNDPRFIPSRSYLVQLNIALH
jgi:hypothetical protein